MSPWNDLVKKVYKEEHDKDSTYQFKQAMKDASKRKSEMGQSGVAAKKSRKGRSKRGKKGGKRGTRKKSRKH